MKKFCFFFFEVLFSIGITCLPCQAKRTTPSPTPPPTPPTPDTDVTLTPTTKPNPGHLPDPDPNGERDLGTPVYCHISMQYGIETDPTLFGIISYEIYTGDGSVCVAAYPDENSFIQRLFSLPEGVYQIRLETYDTVYSGIIN